jgi:hypothetical protein
MARCGQLSLRSPSYRPQFISQLGILNDDEPPRLKTKGTGRQTAGFENDIEILIGNLFCFVEFLGSMPELKSGKNIFSRNHNTSSIFSIRQRHLSDSAFFILKIRKLWQQQ